MREKGRKTFNSNKPVFETAELGLINGRGVSCANLQGGIRAAGILNDDLGKSSEAAKASVQIYRFVFNQDADGDRQAGHGWNREGLVVVGEFKDEIEIGLAE